MLAFPFVWTEQGDIQKKKKEKPLYTNANRKWFCECAPTWANTHTHKYANKHSLKGQLFCFGTPDLSHENIDRGKGSIAKCGLKMRWAKSTASYLYSERLPSYKYWKKDTGGERKRPNGAFEKWHTWAPHGISSPPVRSHPIWSK